MESKSES